MQNKTQEPTANSKFYESLMSLVLPCLSDLSSSQQVACAVSKMVGIICGCLVPLLVCFGLLGNGLVAYVTLSRLRPLTRQNVYFGCIALADAVTVSAIGITDLFLSKGLPWLSGGQIGFILLNQGDWGCRLSSFLKSLSQLLPASILLMMVADRTLSMLAPFRFRTLGPQAALRAMLLAAIASVILVSPVLFLMSQVTFPNGQVSCYITDRWVSALLYWNLLCNPPSLVLLAILLTNCVLLCCITRVLKERKLNLRVGGGSGDYNGQSLNGSTNVFALSLLALICSAPQIALFWTLRFLPRQMNPEIVRALTESLWALLALSLVSQVSNLPVMSLRNSRFRRCVLRLMRRLSNTQERRAVLEMRPIGTQAQ